MRRLGSAPTSIFLAALALAGCDANHSTTAHQRNDSTTVASGPAPAHYAVIGDVVQDFPALAKLVDTVEVDLGTPAAHAHLLEGWSFDETQPDGSTVVWGLGGRSSIWFHTSRAAAMLVTFRVLPFTRPGFPQQEIAVLLNGEPIGKRALAAQHRTYMMTLPERHLRLGRNLLEFEYAYSGAPAEIGAAPVGEAAYAALWQWIRFHGATPGAAPTVDPAQATLTIPAGAGVEYYLDAPAASELVIGGLHLRGSTALALEVEPDGGSPHAVQLSAERESLRVPLGDAGIKKISLTALRRGDSPDANARVEITAPVVVAPPAPAPPSVSRPDQPARLPNVMLYIIDTLRADHLGVYGYERPTSPHIDAFARDAVVFSRAQAQASWTRPAVASIFTGMNVRSHGIVELEAGLATDASTLAERLHDAGYRTAGFSLNRQVDSAMGFAQGFDAYEVFDTTTEVVQPAAAWLRANAGAAPLFLFAHAIEPHHPYEAKQEYRDLLAPGIDPRVGSKENVGKLEPLGFKSEISRQRTRFGKPVVQPDRAGPQRDDLVALYDAEVRAADAQFQRFLEMLKDAGLYDESIVILVADHGEELYDHGRLTHGMTLYAEQLRVPLLIKFPHGWNAGGRFDGAAAQIDIMPTVLDFAGLPPADGIDGRSLLDEIAAPSPRPIPVFSLIHWFGGHAESVVYGRYKLIHNLRRNALARPAFEVFDQQADPVEQHNLWRDRPVLTRFLRALLRRDAARPRALEAVQAELPDGMREHLRALGYID